MAYRVLLVEDDFLIATLSRSMIEMVGCEVVGPVQSVERGLDQARNAQIDAAVLDVQILGGTSLPIAEELLKRGVPFVFVSGFADIPEMPEHLRNCMRLEKPVDDEQLARALRQMLKLPDPTRAQA